MLLVLFIVAVVKPDIDVLIADKAQVDLVTGGNGH